MSWKRYLRVVNTPVTSKIENADDRPISTGGLSSKYSSYLPEVYAGHPQRIQRYYQYDDMDLDSDIGAALDTIADFCTQSEEQNDEPFDIHYLTDDSTNPTEQKLIRECLTKWIFRNDFNSRLWYIFRDVIKNGDAFFLRDPETGVWDWLDHYSVELVKVDTERGKVPEEYIVRGLDWNLQAKYATEKTDITQFRGSYSNYAAPRAAVGTGQQANPFQLTGPMDSRQQRMSQPGANELYSISADNVVHLSLSVGMNPNWPFGQSVLQPVYKTFKQKQMLEDAVIIYRTTRAPERLVFYIDTGTQPPQRQKAILEQVKNELHQRRIPNRTGGGQSILDAAYNPLSIVDNYFFAQSAEGRGSKVETLQGGENLGEIGDLSFFTKKLARAMRIPSTYLPMGDEDGQATYQDGKLGAALIQEFRFNKYCMRIQSLLAPIFDREFKRYLEDNGIMIDRDVFQLRFNPPQNFTKYRQMEIDAQQVSVYQMVADNRFMAERFKFKRFLNLTEEEIADNERMFQEENADRVENEVGTNPADNFTDDGLSAVGINSAPDLGMGMDDLDIGDEMGGDEMGGDDAGGASGDAPGGDTPPPPR